MLSAASGLWPFFFSSLGLAFLYDLSCIKKTGVNGEKIYVKKGKFWFVVLTVAMVFYIGLRKWCNDTSEYRDMYTYITSSIGSIFQGINWSLGDSPGFVLTNTIIKHLGFGSQDFILFYSAVTVSVYIWFIRKYSTDFWLSFFLFWVIGSYLFAAAAMRQCIATALCLIGTDRLLKKKYILFLFWVFIASSFHLAALIFAVIPFLFFKPWSTKMWLMIFGFMTFGFFLQYFAGAFINLAAIFGKDYAEGSFSGEGVNVFRLAVTWAPVILSFLVRDELSKSNDKEQTFFINLSALNASIMFVALFGTANYIARLANYFQFFQLFALPFTVKFFDSKSQVWLKPVIVICYMAYFMYTYLIYNPYDWYIQFYTIREYIQMH